ncbi:class I SAM-dependent methyltransferase [Rhizosphaericola mali]|uniref:Class I SAM-dependent methyltransferase n=1 Tax=Rhizosphaericola mali TaxID=2545455 RepID=A0A5P2G051_9BACT|nr:class I SAM-dependent methyltransferase [Rhizosphaericola mali]QES87499.1 class I SAM-dependent methyltransferase [Rhizosphaericola mali]
MKCSICGNDAENKCIVLTELYFQFNSSFPYFECIKCGCIQIERIPDDLGKYYPKNYYSFHLQEIPLNVSFLRKIHYQNFANKKYPFSGFFISKIFKPSGFHYWLKKLNVKDTDTHILDIGCGNGNLLKRIFRLGFNNLLGIDPFLEKEQKIATNFAIEKKEIFDLNDQFDVVMMHHSLEHMDRQHDVIEQFSKLLKPNGHGLIRIPIVSIPLMERFGKYVVSLDPPRHLFVHSINSIQYLLEMHGLEIYDTVYDADLFSIKASEQYKQGIALADKEKSYIENPSASIFSNEDDIRFAKEIKELNLAHSSDNVALYIRKKNKIYV